jgi:hypothetical protein
VRSTASFFNCSGGASVCRYDLCMIQPGDTLQTLSSRAGRALVRAGVPHQAGDDLAWAWFNLGAADMGRTIVARLATDKIDHLTAMFSQPWDILEVGAMSLAFEDVMTALDLCADAIFLACREPLDAAGRFYDLGNLKKRHQRLSASPSIRAWIDQLLRHPDLSLAEDCRHPLTHRFVRRHILMAVGEGPPSARSLSEITTLHGVDPPRGRGSIGVLIPRVVGFGEAQLESLCRAILTDFPAPP